jgi:hypothetical protein
MTLLFVSVVIAVTVVKCFKAYYSTKLLEINPEAWSRLQEAEDEKRRRRETMIGNVLVAGWRRLRGKKE